MPTHPSSCSGSVPSAATNSAPSAAQAAAPLEASESSNTPPPAVAAPSSPETEPQGAWAWASDELKQKIRKVWSDEAGAAASSPARRFGESLGALGLGDKLGLNPHREIEKLKTANEALEHRIGALEKKPKRQRRPQRFGGRGVKKNPDFWLMQLVEAVIKELKAEHCPRKEHEAQLVERVYSLAADDLAAAICKRFGKNRKQKIISGRTIRRSVTDWKTLPDDTRKKTGVTYHSKLYGAWRVHRIQAGVESELVDGSCDEVSGGGSEDTRAVSLLDGASKSVTRRDATLVDVHEHRMTAHVGGSGALRFRRAGNLTEENEDRVAQDADEMLKSAGFDPTNVRG